MFKRLIVEDWQNSMHITAMCIFLTVFAFTFLRALCMSRSKADKISSLPLEKEKPQQLHERK